MKPLRGILFDFNGTLFFDSKAHIEAFLCAFRDRSLPQPEQSYIAERFFGKTNEQIYLECYNSKATKAEIQTFVDEKEKYYQEFVTKGNEFAAWAPFAKEFLTALKELHIPFCMATGSGIENVAFYQRTLGIGEWFDDAHIVYNDGSFPGKPFPDVYQKAAAALGLLPQDCLVFEDGTPGITAARRAGVGALVCIVEEWLPNPLKGEATADEVIHSYADWKKTLKKYGFCQAELPKDENALKKGNSHVC